MRWGHKREAEVCVCGKKWQCSYSVPLRQGNGLASAPRCALAASAPGRGQLPKTRGRRNGTGHKGGCSRVVLEPTNVDNRPSRLAWLGSSWRASCRNTRAKERHRGRDTRGGENERSHEDKAPPLLANAAQSEG